MTPALRIALATLAAALIPASALADTLTGSGHAVTQERAVPAFTAIGLALPGRLDLTQGPKASVTITAEDNVLPEIESVVEGGALKLRFSRRYSNYHVGRIRIAVTAPAIDSLAVSGSGDIVAAALEAKNLKVAISGSGNVTVDKLQAENLSASIGGSGNFSAAGHADTFSASIAGSGDVKARRLETGTASVNIAGSGDAALWVRRSLSVNVVGSGDVLYYGDPTVERAIVGSGSVRRLGASPG